MNEKRSLCDVLYADIELCNLVKMRRLEVIAMILHHSKGHNSRNLKDITGPSSIISIKNASRGQDPGRSY